MTHPGRKLSGATEIDFSRNDEEEMHNQIFFLIEEAQEKFKNMNLSVEELKDKCLEFVADECQKNPYLSVKPHGNHRLSFESFFFYYLMNLYFYKIFSVLHVHKMYIYLKNRYERSLRKLRNENQDVDDLSDYDSLLYRCFKRLKIIF